MLHNDTRTIGVCGEPTKVESFDVTNEEVFDRWLLTSEEDLRTLDEWAEERGNLHQPLFNPRKKKLVQDVWLNNATVIVIIVSAILSLAVINILQGVV